MDKEFILSLVTLIISALFGTGGLCAFIITIIKLQKKSEKYVVRCKLASDFIKKDIVKVEPPEAKKILTDILDGVIDSKEQKNKAIKEARKK